MNRNVKRIIFIAMAVAINMIGSKLALLLSLPIFLDSIGTILAGVVLGPMGGMIAALVGGLVNGALGDIYSIYFAPSGMIMGLMAGLLLHNKKVSKPSVLWRNFCIVLPASAVSSLIEVILFGGVTSAAVTTAIVQVLSKTALTLFGSAFLTQFVTDYIDKLIAIILVFAVINRLPYEMTHFEKEN